MIDPFTDLADPNTLHLDIPFTQYLRPDGRKRPVIFTVAGDTAVKADKVLRRGWRFEAEVLVTGEVSLTVEDDEDDEYPCQAIQIVPNGPEVPKAVERLVNDAAEQAAKDSHDATDGAASGAGNPPPGAAAAVQGEGQ